MVRFCGRRVNADPNALPIYRQPCDVPALLHVRAVYKNGFRRHLIEYIHRRKRASKARLEFLSSQYAKVAQVSSLLLTICSGLEMSTFLYFCLGLLQTPREDDEQC